MNLTHLHVLFHGGDVDLVSDLQLVVVAGIHQHLVIESPVPHLTSGILCSLERERGGEYGQQGIEYGRGEGGIIAQSWLGMAEYGGQLSMVQYGSVGQSHECVHTRAMAQCDQGHIEPGRYGNNMSKLYDQGMEKTKLTALRAKAQSMTEPGRVYLMGASYTLTLFEHLGTRLGTHIPLRLA